MPRLVDYAGGFAQLREVAFELVRGSGVDALSRRAVADRIGMSRNSVIRLVDPDVDLAVLAAEKVQARHRHGRWFRAAGAGDLERATWSGRPGLVASLMPEPESRVDEELVWLRIAVAGRLGWCADTRAEVIAPTLGQALATSTSRTSGGPEKPTVCSPSPTG